VSDREIKDVHLFLLRHGQEVLIGFAGGLPPQRPPFDIGGASSKTAGSPQRIPDDVIIRWKASDGHEQHQVVSLAGITTNMNDFHGTVWLRFDGMKWQPIALTEEQMEKRSIVGKSAAPVDASLKQ
jgi:hypothetical protein